MRSRKTLCTITHIVKSRILSIPLSLASFLLLIGFLARVQHWPYGNNIERIAFFILATLYTFRYFGKSSKKTVDTLKFVLITTWCALSIFASFKLQNTKYLIYVVILLGIVWLVHEILATIKKGVNQSNLILFAGAILLAIETIFRIQHLPGSSLIHLVSLLLISIGFALDKYFWQNKK